MLELHKFMKITNEFIFDNNINKLCVTKKENDLFEFKLIKKSTQIIINVGIINYNDLINESKKYITCYLDGYLFDIIDDCYQ
jgi:hypothetical protein